MVKVQINWYNNDTNIILDGGTSLHSRFKTKLYTGQIQIPVIGLGAISSCNILV